jgi:hypothetical protein
MPPGRMRPGRARTMPRSRWVLRSWGRPRGEWPASTGTLTVAFDEIRSDSRERHAGVLSATWPRRRSLDPLLSIESVPTVGRFGSTELLTTTHRRLLDVRKASPEFAQDTIATARFAPSIGELRDICHRSRRFTLPTNLFVFGPLGHRDSFSPASNVT